MLLDEWLRDFPFVDTASRAHAVAAPLTAVVRELIDGPTPLVAIDAPAPGSGKGLYAESCGILIAGTSPAVMSDTPNEEELRKRITAVLRDLSPVILLDNIGRRLASPTLAAALTAPIWKDRLLGQSQTVELPNRALWLATGNNLDFNNELVRRTIAIRLDARVDRPWERSGFRHDPLIPWVRCHRHELVWALLVLVQHWRACGRPAWSGRAFGSFEAWSAVVGGILQAAGIEGFLANREEQYRRADSDTEDWRAFVSAWWAKHGAVAVKTSDLHQLALADELLPSILAGVRGDSSERAVKTRLGLALKQRRDRQIGGFFLRGLGQDSHTKGALYQLESADGAPNVPPAGEGSANVPQDNWSTPGTNAVPAVPAVPFSNLHAGKSIPTELGAGTAALATEVPQVPHVPQSGTKTPPFTAEPGAAGHPDVPQEVPQRCERCGRPLPANATANRCAGCPAWQSG